LPLPDDLRHIDDAIFIAAEQAFAADIAIFAPAASAMFILRFRCFRCRLSCFTPDFYAMLPLCRFLSDAITLPPPAFRRAYRAMASPLPLSAGCRRCSALPLLPDAPRCQSAISPPCRLSAADASAAAIMLC